MLEVLDRDVTEEVVPGRREDSRRGWEIDSSSDGTDEDDCEVEGEAVLVVPTAVNTRAHGARVRSVGPRSGRATAPTSLPASCRLGKVNAQPSQGPARLVTYSS